MRSKFTPLALAAVAALGLSLLAAPAGAKTKTKTYTSPNVIPIPDDPGPGVTAGPLVASPITVKNKGNVKNIKVGVRISHTRDNDLHLYLFKGGMYTRLSNANGGNGNGYGAGSADCAGQRTLFDDDAASFIQFNPAPFAGSFKPEDSLGLYDGRSTKGTWSLVAFDSDPGQTGSIDCWAISIKRKT